MAGNSGFHIKRIEWDSEMVQARLRSATERSLTDAAEFLLEEANRTVPLDEGTLQRSGEVSYGNKEAVVSYSTPYAVRLHEHPEYNFQRGRRGKWLERTLQEQHRPIAQRIADGLDGALS